MKTNCTETSYEFQSLNRRKVLGAFDGGKITSDAGAVLLREVEKRCGIIRQFSQCFKDYRDPDLIEHTTEELVSQRVYGLALGYEDLNDHDTLRMDPLLATLVGKSDPTGSNRIREDDRGNPLAGKSTLNRLELTPPSHEKVDRYKKIVLDWDAVNEWFVNVFVQAHSKVPERVVQDLDATDDPLHGQQEGRFFHGYYKEYCYLPLYIFCGEFSLCARLRESNIDAAQGSVEEVERIVEGLRAVWPKVEIAVRGDSGFCREDLMAWCETNDVHFIIGVAKNNRLVERIEKPMKKAAKRYAASGEASREFADFRYKTLKTWNRKRRIIGKAEYLPKGANPRFVVTSYSRTDYEARSLYEEEYCARGEMENRIKEQQLYLFADRTSTHQMHSNQVRLWFSSVAYVLMQAFRRLGLAGTEMAKAQCHTIRLKLFKVGAHVRISVRRVVLSMASGWPYRELFDRIYWNLKHCMPLRI